MFYSVYGPCAHGYICYALIHNNIIYFFQIHTFANLESFVLSLWKRLIVFQK